jgi:eukaryotic-like serine/threonine-protein kinase
MSGDVSIFALLEDALTSGRPLEEICRDCPELLPKLRHHVELCQDLDENLEQLFPSTNGSGRKTQVVPAVPEIPGYTIQCVLGRGGLGIVYQAFHSKLNRVVALKMLLSGEYASPLELSRLLSEARAIAALQHPNIVQVYDVGEIAGRPFFTMELVENGTLAKQLGGKPLQSQQAASLMIALASATDAAHRAGIVHRDLKPANILMAADETPKISDFGLARQFAEEMSLLTSMTPIGTPSYMAPEQVRGTADASSPLVDVYALGAVLYETLTGRPPFHGATSAQTHQQVLTDEPVFAKSANARVPHDLRIICLKCLHKSPQRRYSSAADLAADLRRFIKGEPISARPTGWIERTVKWTRRHPTSAMALSATAVLMLAGTIALIRFHALQSQQWRTLGADLAEVKTLEDGADWSGAQGVLDRASDLLKGRAPAALLARLDQARRDLELLMRLDAIHLSRVTGGDLSYYREKADQDYRAAFADAFSFKVGDAVSVAAAQVNGSAIRTGLAVAIDDWSISASDPADRQWLLELARLAQPGGRDNWGDRIRDADNWAVPSELTDLAQHVPIDRVPVSALLTLGDRLKKVGAAPSSNFLRRVQQAHPADFWVNLTLGTSLLWQNPGEAESYCRAALASRPMAAVSYNVLANSLRAEDRPYDAITAYRKALNLDPRYARARTDFGNALSNIGRFNQAIECYDAALASDPQYIWANHDAGDTLVQMGRFNDAVARYQSVIASELNDKQVERGWRTALVLTGHADQAMASWQEAIRVEPDKYEVSAGYAELVLYLQKDDEYEAARATLLQRFASTKYAPNVQAIAFACLLKPADDGMLRQIADLLHKNPVSKASKPAWVYNRSIFNDALLAYRRRDIDRAIKLLSSVDSGTLGPCPKLVLAMAQADAGQVQRARKTLSEAMTGNDWRTTKVTRFDFGEYHVLRREAETKLLPNLQAFLNGSYVPQDNVERLSLIGACTARNLNALAAGLYAGVFAENPAFGQEMAATVRFHAACAAAKAGGSAWQGQARQLLTDDLSFKSGRTPQSDAFARSRLEHELGQWQTDPDLATVRELPALSQMAPPEKQAWTTFWQNVADEMNHLQGAS